MSERVLMTGEDVRRALVRIAHEIVEAHRGARDLVIIGMRTRGVPLAKRLAQTIEEIEGETVPVGSIDISFYRDDLPTRGPSLQVAPSDIPTDINGKRVVLVDDVLFTGRSDPRRPGRGDGLRPAPAHPARGARRPWPPRAADPARLRRQERPHRTSSKTSRSACSRPTAATKSQS